MLEINVVESFEKKGFISIIEDVSFESEVVTVGFKDNTNYNRAITSLIAVFGSVGMQLNSRSNIAFAYSEKSVRKALDEL